jgi:hypothetical protein
VNPPPEHNVRWLHAFLLFASIAVLGYQFSSLYLTPRPDCDRWHGDETWLMREFGTQMTTGVMRYPEALDATIGERNTFPVSSMWLNAVVYGVPVTIFHNYASIVDVGRTVTGVLTIVLLFAVYWIARQLGARREWAALAILVLITTRTFFLASHSARYDIWVGLGVLLAWFTAIRLIRSKERISWLLFGFSLPLLLVWNIHALRIAGALWAFAFFAAGGWKSVKSLVSTVASAAIGFAILAAIYLAFSGSIMLSDPHSGGSQFDQVMKNIPILHPFAPQLQWANIVIRFNQWYSEAALWLLMLASAFVAGLTLIFRDSQAYKSPILIATVLVIFAWVLTMRPLPYYDLHILPILTVAAAVVLSRTLRASNLAWIAIAVLAIVIIAFSIKDTSVAKANGELATNTSARIAREIREDILKRSPTKPTVMAEIPLISYFVQDTALKFIAPYFLIFPKDSITPPEFLQKHAVQFVAVEGTHLTLPSGFTLTGHGYDADSLGILINRYVGYFNDNYRSYFQPFQPPPDTLSLYQIKAR